MNLTLAAIGRLKSQEPEHILTLDWMGRADAMGKPLGFKSVRLMEVDPRLREPDRDKEAAALLAAIEPGSFIIALDERGDTPGSVRFANRLAALRDQGTRQVVLVIGGPDGHGEALKRAAHQSLAFGSWTWPHKLVRAMAAEQIYRAIAILSGTPYHRV
ncbi:ribosomal RNA large subunit methyltransferase H [Candidatus Phycosocius bacilliformis]|uniref:Ribosomal RNA large subunit methyltransferase H n=1 Tax=Candidatus Phycosocius bacilliformis TaxID=1445552 RepID=A0A2P2EEF5_9PROT|nr:23S rRNA (pseudouridine(1915)-N(3))-methyltransferase RlmH [Candidatus Phycosocius bacilliformis]GBF59444.1 ribosomal RNA large subunit methyltransferase H [Candidatus Phycosocius bacilliformis]